MASQNQHLLNPINDSQNHFYLDEVSLNNYPLQENNNNNSSSQQTRRISDPIHKFIELPRSMWRIVDTPQFQRLRFIKQLGITGFVFNGANHTRFEHCLGVAHLAWTYVDTIAKNHQHNFQEMGLAGETNFDKVKLLVSIAGLCHDLGHGPFSHMFDNVLLPRLNEFEWKHEEGSCMMIKSLLAEPSAEFSTNPIQYKNVNFAPETDLEVVLDMIQGLSKTEWTTKYSNSQYPKWTFDIVANKTTTIDVDKFDYLKRDPSGLNIKHEYDSEMLFRETRIIDGEICYNSKLHDQVYDIFHIRYKLFKQIYQHRVSQGIELMLCDALEIASKVYNFKEIIRDPEQYLKLTDSIIEQILYSPDENLKESQNIIKRIIRRDLFRFVGEVVIEQTISVNEQQVIEGISRHCENDFGFKSKNSRLTPEECSLINVIQSKINYCSGEQDPVLKVFFFKSSNPTVKRLLSASNSALLRPSHFGERIIRVFIKVNDPILFNKVKTGFANYTSLELKKEKGDYDKGSSKKPLISSAILKSPGQNNMTQPL